MARVGRGEAAIQAYVDSVIERDSYKPQLACDCLHQHTEACFEEQTPARNVKLTQAKARVELCIRKLNGGQLGEARRRLAYIAAMVAGAAVLEREEFSPSLREE